MFQVSFEPEILQETPNRVLPFLRAIATRVEIRAAMAACGYTEEEQAYGWKLLLEATGHVPSTLPETDDQRARAAIAELDGWDESGFRRIHAALGRLHPEQDAFVFAGIEPAIGAGAVVSVATVLDRLDALERSPERAATREADKAAVVTLARRGIDRAERKRLRDLVTIAQTAKLPIVPEPSLGNGAREQALRDLRAWYKDWAETARAVIARRDHLLLMGLGKRRSRSLEEEPTVPAAPAAPAAPVGLQPAAAGASFAP